MGYAADGLIAIHDMAIGYGRKVVARGLHVSVPAGRLACLVGENGVGKSTLLKTIAGFQKPLSGKLYLQGREAAGLTHEDHSRLLSVVLTQKPEVQNITVRELVGLGRSPYTGFWGSLTDADKAIVDEAIQLVGISQLGGRTVSTLSDGERQKAMIARAMAQQTPIILLDEPTAFLDYPGKVEMMRLLRRMATEMHKVVLLSTHDLELALQFADTLFYIGDGSLREISKAELSDYIVNITQGSGKGA
ncbi:ABC transporter ATP-binding protein [Prevotella sp. KH2C16]|uniref:ABC transporter ATP-binding protein n=1 Tax=Prevotella sp. KH2C16 TaxID=1855325 RepID=UPI0008EEEDB3|nr:ABC transporter ATP-binding protein [Prevotella sp. KH2C16]SFG64154.1 iron complex transport system ATP-binding protein [Prevotella sp. KH2C16]